MPLHDRENISLNFKSKHYFSNVMATNGSTSLFISGLARISSRTILTIREADALFGAEKKMKSKLNLYA